MINIVRRASSSPLAEVRDRLRSLIPRCVPFLIAVTAAWPALAEQVTKTVTYNGAKMEMIGTDDAIIEIKDETRKIFVRGKWDNETEELAGQVLGTCPFQVRGTINYTGALMIFGQQPACDNEPAQWKTMRFIGPPEKIGSNVKPTRQKGTNQNANWHDHERSVTRLGRAGSGSGGNLRTPRAD